MNAPRRTPLRILVSGSTGLIGRALVFACRSLGDEVIPLVRKGSVPGAVHWDAAGELNPSEVSGFDAVVHLAGEPVSVRWTAETKRRIRDSRVEGTYKLASALARAARPPRVFISASGVNFYGNAGSAVLDEFAPPGRGFLAEVSQQWEAATAPLAGHCRILHARIGVVLAAHGGALGAVLPLFRLGLAGPIAGGRAFVSWITLEDVIRSIGHMLASTDLSGPLNVVAPAPVTSGEFTSAVAQTVHRPAVIRVPAWAMRLMLGEVADETVLASIRAVPRRLLEDGFVFAHPTLADALTSLQI